MADEDIEDGETENVPLPESGMKKKILLYLIPAIVLIGIGVGAVAIFFTNVGNDEEVDYDVVTTKNTDGSGDHTTVFYTLPELSSRLRTSSGVFETVRMKLNLELPTVEDIATINAMLPRINDILISHVSELTPEEVSGAEGFYALKSELLHRINLIVSPIKIINLNIKDLNVEITDTLEKQED